MKKVKWYFVVQKSTNQPLWENLTFFKMFWQKKEVNKYYNRMKKLMKHDVKIVEMELGE
jgi:sugar (pentulose or hexulose) kinase